MYYVLLLRNVIDRVKYYTFIKFMFVEFYDAYISDLSFHSFKHCLTCHQHIMITNEIFNVAMAFFAQVGHRSARCQ